jgi:hypothetical protein
VCVARVVEWAMRGAEMWVCNVGEPSIQRDMDERVRGRAMWLMLATSDVGKMWEINDRQRCEW